VADVRDFGEARLALDARALLGECPLWSAAEQALYWVDISARRIHRFDPARGDVREWEAPCEPGCIGLAAGGGLVAALRDGFYRLDTASGALKKIADAPPAPYDPATMRFNDGRCDAAGRFWAGAMYEPRTAEAAGVFVLERGRVREGWGPAQGAGVKVSNGMAFTANGRHVHQSDTPNHVIYRFAFDVTSGSVGTREIFARCADNRTDADYGGRPDGAAIDSAGNYWSAQYEGGRVLRFSPVGEVTGVVHVPVRRTTMIAFGGPQLKTLFITTAREGAGPVELARQPFAGGIFSIELDIAGRAEPAYID
jgi:sugar lactone lactonase YvrE